MYTIVFDCETTHKGGPDHDSPEAQYPSNEVVRVGWKGIGSPEVKISNNFDALIEELTECHSKSVDVTLVAHNLKFDLKWLKRYDMGNDTGFCELWDTMTFEYLATGQDTKFISLEDLAAKYGIKAEKTMDLGEYIAAGGRVEDIPKKELDEYLTKDVEILEQIHMSQTRTGRRFDMNYIHALAEMELNGLPIDRDETERRAKESAEICDEFTDFVKDCIMERCEWQDGTPIEPKDFEKKIKPTANRTLSFLLTGEPVAVRTTSDKWTFKYKDGRRSELGARTISRIWTEPPNHLGYSMDEKHIAAAIDEPTSYATPILDDIPKWRKHDKLLNTYYLPFLTMSQETGCVHPKLNTCATATGRLSSSAPNGQNLPTEARSLVTAPEGYKVVELDFSQLELVALAMICKDPAMIKDLSMGEDIHYNSGQRVMGWTDPSEMNKKDRTLVKNVNFGAVYGGKAPGLSKQTGVDKDIIQKLINSLYRRYPGIGTWQKELYEEVVENMEPAGHDDHGEQRYKATVEVGKRLYTFHETPSPRWLRARTGRGYSFNPNQVYNYPIQGFAGWSIVLQFLYALWSQSELEHKYIMTVHDSIIVLVPEDSLASFEGRVTYELQRFSEKLGIPFNLNVDIDVGQTWS